MSEEWFDPDDPDIGYRGSEAGPPGSVTPAATPTLQQVGQAMRDSTDAEADSRQGGIVSAITGVVGDTLEGLATFVAGWNTVTAKNAAKALEAENRLAAGATFYDDFNRADSPTLGNGWVQFGAGQTLQIIDNAARIDNTEGLLGVDSGRQAAVCPVLQAADDVVVSVVVNPKGIAIPTMSSIFLRANVARTEFVYANVYARAVYIGRGTRSGDSWAFSDWAWNTDVRIRENATLRFIATGTHYELRQDDAILCQFDDTGGSPYPIDAGHRTTMFASETKIVNWLPSYSWGLAAFAHRPATMADIAGAAQTAEDAQATATKVAGDLAAFLEETKAGASEIKAAVERFSTYTDAAVLDPDRWFQPTTYATRLASRDGRVGIAATGDDVHAQARFKTAATMNDFIVKTVIASAPQSGTIHGLAIRSNTAMTAFVYVHTNADRTTIGRGSYSGSGNTFTWSEWAQTPTGGVSGQTLECHAHGNTYEVWLGGGLILTHENIATDPGGVFPVDDSHRFGCVLIKRWSSFWTTYLPSVSMFAIADYTAPQYTGIGWRVSRSDATETASQASLAQLSNVFTAASASTKPEGIVADLPSGTIQAPATGRYSISGGLTWDTTSAANTPQFAQVILYRADALTPTNFQRFVAGNVAYHYNDNDVPTASTTLLTALSTEVWLNAGDRVQLRLRHSGAEPLVGDASGSNNWFSGSLVTSIQGPRGDQGPKGEPGIVVEVGTVTASAPGSAPVVTLTPNEEGDGQVLDMTLPRGEVGPAITHAIVASLPGTGTLGTVYWIPA